MSEPQNGLNSPNSFSQPNQAQDNSWTIGPREFILKYLRYLPWVMICVALALVFAYLKIRYTTPIFSVQSSLLINDDKGSAAGKDAKFDELFMSQGAANLNNEIQILKSTPVMNRVIKALDLQTQYYGQGSIRSALLYPESPVILNIQSIADSSHGFGVLITVLDDSRYLIGTSKTPVAFGQVLNRGGNQFSIVRDFSVDLHNFPKRIFRLNWSPLPNMSTGIIRSLKVAQTNEQATILNLSYEGENPNLGKDILNTLMTVYDSMIVEDKKRITQNTLHFINDRLDTLKYELGGSERSLKGYMVKNDVFDIEGQSKNYLENLGTASKAIVEQQLKLKVLDWMMAYINDNKNVYKLVPVNLGIEEPILVKLVTEYNNMLLQRDAMLKTTTPNNQLVVTLTGSIERVRHDISEALQNVKQSYSIALNSLQHTNGELQGQLKSIPDKSQGLANIKREQKILEDLYSFLLQKQYETNISSASIISNSKIVEPAASTSTPLIPNPKSIYTLYTLFGIIIPALLIIVIELLRDKIANRIDVEKRTNAPILGEIGHSEDSATLVVKKNSRRFISEQFRIIRSNLQYVIGKKERPVIMVTSSFSGEGKSFVSTNVGAVMSLTGKKTVIMEFDIRKPKIVSGLELKRNMGITNYIIGKAKFSELIIPVEGMENLFVIPCGPIPPNPSELLLDEKLNELMNEAKAEFEVVILDTAPVGLVSDAVNLGRFADCTLFIIRQGYTFRKQLRLIDELYREKKLPLVSLLLNDVKSEGGYYSGYYGGYGYYGGKNYGYESGYFENEPKKAGKSFFRRAGRWWRHWFG